MPAAGGRRRPECPRSPRRRLQTWSEASQLPAWPRVGRPAASAGGEVRRGCRNPVSRGGSFLPWSFWPQNATPESRRPEPEQLASSGVHPARVRRKRVRRGAGRRVTALAVLGGGGGLPKCGVVGLVQGLELLGNRPTLRSA